jgi:GWxTD domain-containing protein
MKLKTSQIPLFLLLIASLFSATQKVREKDLPQKYQDWLKLTAYIISEKEKDVFLQLTTDRERDLFMESFWKQRDPTPGTPQNEYQEEHLKRFKYANENFRRGSGREGWMTDMGRIHIILGPAVSYDRTPSSSDVYPYEIWTYYGDVEKGLPTHFCLVFFQRGGVGEYKLYSPTSDGPASLLVKGRQMDPFDYEELYRQILDLEPSLAPVCLSVIPGDVGYYFQPSPENAIIMADIFESPKKNINPAYATHFLNLRGVVSTEYLTNFVESTADIALIRDPLTRINFMNFSIAPSNISIDKYEPKDQYFCNFTMSVSLKRNEVAIFQYTKEFPFYFPSQDLEKVRSSGVSFEDSVPVVAGKYNLDVLLQNSVGKEFCVFEKAIEVPADSGLPQINGPFLGYNFHESDINQHLPFKAGNRKLLVDPQKHILPE